MKKKNQGFSLIELIVVIAIMTILTLGLTISLSSISNQKAKVAAKTIFSSLQYTQTAAMAKESAYLKIYCDADGYCLEMAEGSADDLTTKVKKLGDGKIAISYETGAGDKRQIRADEPLYIRYDHVTGALLSLEETTEGGALYCQKITVSKNNYEASITLVPQTGHAEMTEN